MQTERILIIDEAGFSRVCSAILEVEGYSALVVSEMDSLGEAFEKNFRLAVTSYPYGTMAFEHLKKMKIPTIILSDQLNKELMKTLEGFNNSYCMIKPLDYEKFRSLVRQVLGKEREAQDGFKII
jgi:DNA-binding NtrC family response regulator